MRVAGIICEYNPLHNGHLYHIEQTKEQTGCDHIVCVMSGNFTQRGEPSIADKWTRTRWALEAGASLVLELPAVYAVQSAERFAHGAVNTLEGLGICDYLSFGIEQTNIDLLYSFADVLNDQPEYYKYILKENLNKGLSFPSAREEAMMHFMSDIDKELIRQTLNSSNCILAIEYLRALKKTSSKMKPVFIERKGSLHSAISIPDGEFASAKAIRTALDKGQISELTNFMPPYVFKDVGNNIVLTEMFSQLVIYDFRKRSIDDIYCLHDVTEGLENRLKKYSGKYSSLQTFLSSIKSKRFTMTRLQRICIYSLLGLQTDFVEELDAQSRPSYARILGMDRCADDLFGAIKQNATIEIISKASNFEKRLEGPLRKMFLMDILSTDIYSLVQQKASQRDFTEEIVIKGS